MSLDSVDMMWAKFKLLLTWWFLRLMSAAIVWTLRLRVSGVGHLSKIANTRRGTILSTWHSTTLIPIHYFRNRGYHAIVSVSRDGEMQGRFLASKGFRLIRGSTGRRAVGAFLGAARCLRDGGVLAITPDGPRGPAREVQQGVVELAARTGSLIAPIGVACRRGKRARSWDRYLIPCPFSAAGIFVGEPIAVDIEEKPVEEWRLLIREAMDAADIAAADLMGGKSV